MLSAEYTDNVSLDPDGGRDAAGERLPGPESDIITVVTPGFTLAREGRKATLSLRYDCGYSVYADASDRNSLRHTVALLSTAEPGRHTTLRVSDTFLFTEDPLPDDRFETAGDPGMPGAADPTTLRSREPYWVNTLALGAARAFGRSGAADLDYSHTLRDDDDPDGNGYARQGLSGSLSSGFGADWRGAANAAYETADYDNTEDLDAWDGGLRLTRRLSERLQVFGGYSFRTVAYDETAIPEQADGGPGGLPVLSSSRDYSVHTPTCGFDGAVPGDIDLSAAVGYFYRRRDGGGDESGFSGSLDVSRTFRRTSVRLHGATGHGESLYSRENRGASTYQEAGLTLGRELGRKTSAELFLTWRRDDYDDPAAAGPPAEASASGGDQEALQAGAGLTYRASDWLSAGLRYRRRAKNADVDADEYEENRVTLRVRLTAPES